MSKTINLDSEYREVPLNADGEISIAYGKREIELTVIQFLRSSKGEWIQDITLGLPFEQELRSGVIDSRLVTGILESEISGIPGVQSATVESFEIVGRKMSLDITVVTDSGEIIRTDPFELHPSDSGALPVLPDGILAWQNNPITWLGNNLIWRGNG